MSTKANTRKLKIGILGGTFDPIHIGHLILAQEAYHKYNLDTIYIMPNANPPHKDFDQITDVSHRLSMIKKAIADNSCFQLSTVETDESQKSYTFSTLTKLHENHPESELYFIMGADSLFSIEKWRHPDQIFKNCTIIAAIRDDLDQKDLDQQISYLTEKYSCRIEQLTSFHLEISSKMIRKRVASKEPIQYYVTKDVEQYIYQNKLYLS